MKLGLGIISVLTLAAFSTGCATIFKGKGEAVTFNSNPSGATVVVNGQPIGKTPTQVKLDSDKTQNIEIKKAGFESSHFVISNSVGAGWVILDVLGGIVPVAIDFVTGSLYYLDRTEINASLDKKI